MKSTPTEFLPQFLGILNHWKDLAVGLINGKTLEGFVLKLLSLLCYSCISLYTAKTTKPPCIGGKFTFSSNKDVKTTIQQSI